ITLSPWSTDLAEVDLAIAGRPENPRAGALASVGLVSEGIEVFSTTLVGTASTARFAFASLPRSFGEGLAYTFQQETPALGYFRQTEGFQEALSLDAERELLPGIRSIRASGDPKRPTITWEVDGDFDRAAAALIAIGGWMIVARGGPETSRSLPALP